MSDKVNMATCGNGAVRLRDYPYKMVRFACRNCPRKGQYRLTTMIDRFDGDTGLPEVLSRFVAEVGCQKLENRWSDRCGIHYANLGKSH